MVRKLNSIIKKLDTAFEARLNEYRGEIHRGAMDQRVLGWIVSSDFNGLDYPARQKIMRDIIDEHLTAEEIKLLGPILPYTPEEVRLQESA